MSRSLNRVMLIGNLGKDPELRYTTSGVAVATFSIATNESWKDQDGNQQERTEWHNIVAWKKLAEICAEWLKKGKKVYIEGRIQTRSYDDKNTGAKKYITEIVAENMIMLDSKGSEAQSGSPAPMAEVRSGDRNDDLPF
jgi:single-strand DNA-binding protein